MQCPICEYGWPEGTPVCLRCHYDFANRSAHAALSRLKTKNLVGNTMWFGGTGLVGGAIALFFSLGPQFGGIPAMFMFLPGVLLVTFGLVKADEAKKLLVRGKERTQLPPARVL